MALVNPHGKEKKLKPLLLAGDEIKEQRQKAESLPQVTITSRETSDLIMMGIGAFTPLEGFMGEEDWRSVCDAYTTSNGIFWPIPITLSTSPMNTTGGMYLLPRIVRAFLELYPETEVIFQIESTEWIYEKILQNVVDMGFVGGPTEDSRFRVEPVCLDHLALIVSPSHPLARLAKVPLKELENQPCILPQPGSRTRQFVERKFRETGIKLQVAMQLHGTEAVKKAVEANLGFAVVSGYAVEQESPPETLRILPMKGFDLTRHMELVYRKQKYFSPVAQRFREFVHTYAQQHLSTPQRDVKQVAKPAD